MTKRKKAQDSDDTSFMGVIKEFPCTYGRTNNLKTEISEPILEKQKNSSHNWYCSNNKEMGKYNSFLLFVFFSFMFINSFRIPITMKKFLCRKICCNFPCLFRKVLFFSFYGPFTSFSFIHEILYLLSVCKR